jgi:hypothetical protein
VLDRTAAGETMTHAEVQRLITEAKAAAVAEVAKQAAETSVGSSGGRRATSRMVLPNRKSS